MAKTAKTDRQAKIDQIRSKQKGDERRRGFMIVGVCVVIALLIVGAAAYRPIMNWWELRKFEDLDVASIGAPASVCADSRDEARRRQLRARADRHAGALRGLTARLRPALERAGGGPRTDRAQALHRG